MKMETLFLASSRNGVLLLFVFLLGCMAENRDIYLVLVEGDPVAFHLGTTKAAQQGKNLDPYR